MSLRPHEIQYPIVVTIDGPAGSGKSTVSAKLAKRLNLIFLTTGAFYRGLAFLCTLKKINIENEAEVAQAAHYRQFEVKADINGTQVFIDDQDVTSELSSEKVALVASRISAYPQVREALLAAQRQFNRPPGLIAEGRDCGTVVFPNADVKIFLTASLDKRAERRFSENSETKKAGATNKETLKTIANRDKADSSRAVAPLSKAADTIEVDSSQMNIDEVVGKIEKIVKEKWKQHLQKKK